METVGSGVGVGVVDIDGDGASDLFCVGGVTIDNVTGELSGVSCGLSRNHMKAGFQDVSEVSGAQAEMNYSHACVSGDVNNDGLIDILVTCHGENCLLLNQGHSTFQAAIIGDGGVAGILPRRLAILIVIAALVDCQHNFFCGLLRAADVGDVKEEGRIVDQLPLPFRHRDLFVQHNHAVGLVAFAWRISNLSDEFLFQPLVLVLLFDNHLFFGIEATSSQLFRCSLFTMKLLPCRFIQIFGHFDQFRDRIEAEYKLHMVVMPSIKMARLRKSPCRPSSGSFESPRDDIDRCCGRKRCRHVHAMVDCLVGSTDIATRECWPA
jgi:hypothetical protein